MNDNYTTYLSLKLQKMNYLLNQTLCFKLFDLNTILYLQKLTDYCNIFLNRSILNV